MSDHAPSNGSSSAPKAGPSKLKYEFGFWIHIFGVILILVAFFATIVFVANGPDADIENSLWTMVHPEKMVDTNDLIDANTWIRVQWNQSYVKSILTGDATATVDIRSSLPIRKLNANELTDKNVYLRLLEQGQIHDVRERATVHLVRHGWTWKTMEPITDFRVSARITTFVERRTVGHLSFVSDAGTYSADHADSIKRSLATSEAEGLVAGLVVTILLLGAAIGVARGSPIPTLAALVIAAAFNIGLLPGDTSFTSTFPLFWVTTVS